ncbi:MAG TPA: amidohydrolase family protein [Pseudonocardiaceae bacterium]
MRVIAIEEHFATAELRPANWVDPLLDLGAGRIAEMDAAGVDVQVLSAPPPAVQQFPPDEAVAVAHAVNDRLAEAVTAHPDRFAGFATLPTPAPEAAAAELGRAVRGLGFRGAMLHGHTGGRFFDDQAFWPIFEAAEDLDVPVYLHPAPPPKAVFDAYFSGLDQTVAGLLATAGWGWHVETGLHALRLMVSGLFDRFPSLQVVLGHMGEFLPFGLARADSVLRDATAGLGRTVAEYFQENFHVTTSGFFSAPPLQCALSVVGVDRILFAVDYPYASNGEGVDFLNSVPIAPADRAKIAHLNAERLLGI